MSTRPLHYPSRSWDDVSIGESLGPITYELSLLRLVALVRATGLYDPVHHDTRYAQAAGARDAFISTPHVVGLLRRLLTDWSGPAADIRTLAFRIKAQSCKDDVLTISGRVTGKHRAENGDAIVEIGDIKIGHHFDQAAVTGFASMVFASIEGEPAPAALIRGRPEQVAEAARLQPLWPISRDQMHLWCECIEDWNPLYWDEDYAKASRHRGLVAPFGEWLFGAGSSAPVGIGARKPGAQLPAPIAAGLTGLPLLQALRRSLAAQLIPTPVSLDEFPEVAVGEIRVDYLAPFRPGDTVLQHVACVDKSALKQTRLGRGHFLTFRYENLDDSGFLHSAMSISVLQYRV